MIRKLLYTFAISIGVSLFLTLLFLFGLFESWQNRLSDSLFNPRSVNREVVIIAIDDKSLTSIGRWPWDRDIHARLLDRLNSGTDKPAVIGLDISFFEPSGASDFALADSIQKSGNVILASEVVDNQTYFPIEILSRYAKVGVVNTTADSDGITRKTKLKFDNVNHFAIEVVSHYTGDFTPLTQEGFLRINYAGSPGSFTTYSYIDVLNGAILADNFKDKIVLVGATAPNLHDNQLTPISGTPMAGVEIHANIVSTIIDQVYLLHESTKTTILIIILFTFALAAAFILGRIRLGLAALGVIAIGYLLFTLYSFDQGTIRNLVYPILAVILTSGLSIIYKYTIESSQKRFIRRAFSQYVSAEVVREILANPKKLTLGGEKKTVTVLFSDIHGFTSISETLQPEELTSNLNKYLTKMTDVVLKNNGVLDKFIGDSVMAFWGAPLTNKNHALDACRAALEMRDVRVGQFESRIGVNTGEAVVGNMGSEKRFDYTALGDTVNVASRLEGLNKEYKTQILISENTYREVKDKVSAKKVDQVIVRGKTKPIGVYELIDIK